jgi:hypothetical protein
MHEQLTWKSFRPGLGKKPSVIVIRKYKPKEMLINMTKCLIRIRFLQSLEQDKASNSFITDVQ